MLTTFAVLGTVAYGPSVWLSIRERLWSVAIVDTVAYLLVLALRFAPRLSDAARAFGILFVTYALSVVLLITVGPFGAGELWLFAFPILTGMLAGMRAAIGALLLNLLTLVAFGVAIEPLARSIPAWADRTLSGWVVLCVNFLLLDAVVTVSLAMLVNGLDRAIDRTDRARRRLRDERRELRVTNQRLREEMEERRAAEQRRNQLEKQLMEAQKMEAVGRLAGGVAHDFNNLLTAILGYVEVLQSRLAGPGAPREELGEIQRAARRAADLTQQLLAFGRKQVLDMRVLSLGATVRDAERMLRGMIGPGIRIETDLGREAGRICADAGQIEQVVVNLALNARDAMPEGGTLVIRTSDVLLEGPSAKRLGLPAGRWVLLTVSDSGAGMDEVTLSRIFEPFYTTKTRGRGTGLGLASVYGIVQQTGGQIRVNSTPGQGTRFSIFFPVIEGAESADVVVAPDEDAPVAPRGTETVLLVEDDGHVRRLTRAILEEHGYRVLEAESGAAGIEIARGYRDPIHLVLADLVMPGMNGGAMVERMRSERRDLRALYMSGFADDAVLQAEAAGSVHPAFLRKPFTPLDLVRSVRAVLDAVAVP
jgi:signal transduction histidine kinase/ActR/RegA family two-component response regulator